MLKRGKKRGVSTVIEYVLVISVLLIIAVLVYLFLKSYILIPTLKCSDEVSLLIKSYQCNSNQLTLNLRNNGNFKLEGYYIHATTSPNQEVATFDLSNYTDSDSWISPTGVKLGEIGTKNSFEITKEETDIFDLTESGPIYSVEIIPIRWQEKDKKNFLVSCTNAKSKRVIDCLGACVPDCGIRECGYDPVCNSLYCGDCTGTDTCSAGQCIEIPTGFYISPSGNDVTGDGTIGNPWFTLNRAWIAVQPGNTIYMRGGVYEFDSTQNLVDKSGSAGNLIKIFAYADENPIINPSSTFSDFTGVYISSNYTHLKGIEIAGFEQREGGNWYYAILAEDINNCIFEELDVHHSGFGFFIGNGTTGSSDGNLVLNSDFHHNSDPLTYIEGQFIWGGADGLTIRVSDPDATNTVRGCRMWWNSDEGIDWWGNEGMIIIENTWAFWNGFQPGTFEEGGDGNGFTLGPTYASGVPLKRKITNSLAFQNRVWGFVDNAAQCNMELYNNIAYQNCYGDSATSCGGYFFRWTPIGIPYYIKNNIAYDNEYNEAELDVLTNVNHNSWDSAIVLNDADFLTLSTVGVDGPRQADGSLPDINFLHLAADSDLVNAGVNVGLPYSGSEPDIGAFETNY